MNWPSMRAFSHKSGVPFPTLRNIRCGRVLRPNSRTLGKIESAMRRRDEAAAWL